MLSILGAIPYTTFSEISLGPLSLRTFGFMVAIGVLIGAWIAARYAESYGIPRDTTYSLAMRMVLVGVIGSRITWVASHWSDLDSPLAAFAIWQGGLQFSGGFLFAVIAGYPVYRHWNRLTRWRSLDGYAYGLTIGLAIGRIGCYSVGEHFGRSTDFVLGVRYDGGSTREPAVVGEVFHQTALYELIFLVVLFAFFSYLLYLRKPRPGPGTVMAIFCAYYGVTRFFTDSLRVNDERVLGMTGAQYLCLALLPTAAWIWFRVRRLLAQDIADGMQVSINAPSPEPATEVEPPEEAVDQADAP